jgi:hypothetical protein
MADIIHCSLNNCMVLMKLGDEKFSSVIAAEEIVKSEALQAEAKTSEEVVDVDMADANVTAPTTPQSESSSSKPMNKATIIRLAIKQTEQAAANPTPGPGLPSVPMSTPRQQHNSNASFSPMMFPPPPPLMHQNHYQSIPSQPQFRRSMYPYPPHPYANTTRPGYPTIPPEPHLPFTSTFSSRLKSQENGLWVSWTHLDSASTDVRGARRKRFVDDSTDNDSDDQVQRRAETRKCADITARRIRPTNHIFGYVCRIAIYIYIDQIT